MNDTPQGDGNLINNYTKDTLLLIRMNDTPQGDGNRLQPRTVTINRL